MTSARSSSYIKEEHTPHHVVYTSRATTKMAPRRSFKDLPCHMCFGQVHYPWECPNPLCKKFKVQGHKSWECTNKKAKVVMEHEDISSNKTKFQEKK
jgi:hypothetical protein